MAPRDLDVVLSIQSRCYDSTKQESAASFLAKLVASPQTCFVARLGHETVGYLVSVPVEALGPIPLNGLDCTRPESAVALYLHDMSVHPDARGLGVAASLLDAYAAALRELGLCCGCLTAVNASSPFWRRHGFQEVDTPGPATAHLAAYGPDARFMVLGAPEPGGRAQGTAA